MMTIIRSLLRDNLLFFMGYALLFVSISELTEHLPRSWDPTGIGMLAVIVLFFGFVIGAFKIGASYSDELEIQDPGSIIGVFRRPFRSIKYGLISLALNIFMLYVTILLSSYIMY